MNVTENTFTLDDEKYRLWEKFWRGEMVLMLYTDVMDEYLFYYSGKVWHGTYIVHKNPRYEYAEKELVMSMILNPRIIHKGVEGGTDAKMKKVIGKELHGYDGVYWFAKKRKCEWESMFTGEKLTRKGLDLGDMFLNYFTEMDEWTIKT